MRLIPLSRLLLASTLPVATLAALAAPALADPLTTYRTNTYGLPGGIDTPSAEVLPDATMGASLSWSDYARRSALIFQVTPNLTAGLRYTRIDGLDPVNRGFLWDRSFDLRYQLVGESGWRPAIAAGLQDFMGTGVYSAEYLVATKSLTPRLRASLGIGWGRLAGEARDIDYEDEGGRPNLDSFFSGSAKPFGSITWQASDRLSLTAEYSNDRYELEQTGGDEEPSSHWNFGANWQFGDNYQVSAYTIGGKTFGAQFTLTLDSKKAPFPSGLESAPAPVRPRVSPAADPEGWSGNWAADPTAQPAIQAVLNEALAKEGQRLESMRLNATEAELRINNSRYLQQAEAIGRTARLMTRALPPSVETLVITSVEAGIPTSSVVLRRSDVERLENRAAGEIAQVARIVDADPRPAGLVQTPGLYPRFTWGIRPYLSTSLFDPDDPFRYEVGAQARVTYQIMPGLEFTGSLRQRAFGTIKQEGPGGLTPEEYEALDTDYAANGVPRVRSDSRMYAGNDSPTIPELTLAWYARPTDTTYSRVTVGLLERAYGGVSGEVLWKPVDSRLALGAEVNHVRKRDFDGLFGFRDYETTTGHLSVYYDFGNGFLGQIDAGKYLAGDVGATVSLSRELANGWIVGAYATKTDMSAEDFGEGSFDKGITLSVPLSWATGQPSTSRVGGDIRSLSRDGGTRVRVDGRLYDRVRQSHQGKLYEGWGRFWR